MVMHGMVDNAAKQLKNKKPDESWPHHQDKNGNWVPCASNPCKMHGGSEVMAKNPEEAFEKANSVSWGSFGMSMNQKNDNNETDNSNANNHKVKEHALHVLKALDVEYDKKHEKPMVPDMPDDHEPKTGMTSLNANDNNDGMNDKQKVAWHKLLQSAMDDNSHDEQKHVKLTKKKTVKPVETSDDNVSKTGTITAHESKSVESSTGTTASSNASNAGIITSNRHLMKQRAVIEQRLKDAGIDIIERPVPSQEVIDEMRNNGEYIRDNPLVFNVDSKVNTQELAHAVFKGADFGDEHYNELVQRSNEAWDSMTSDEQAAIYQYTGSAYSSMNKALYKKNYKSEKYDTKKMIADMSSGLSKTENVCQHDTVLYRKRFMKEQDGEYTRSREETAVFQALARVTGKKTAKPTFTRANYMSTANRGFNDSYHDQVRYIISIPKGTHGISVEEHSIHSIEDEFIIDKGYDYEVVGVFQTSEIRKHSNGITNWETGCSPIIALRVIPKKNKSVKLGMTA